VSKPIRQRQAGVNSPAAVMHLQADE